MNSLTIAWVALPFVLGFVTYLLPRFDRWLALMSGLASAGYALLLFAAPYLDGLIATPLTLNLLDSFGVSLMIDQLSGYFILTNALVTMAVLFYCWRTDKTAFFYAQMVILHGSLNAAFICSDFISLYVTLEVSGIASFLLIAYPRSNRSIWVGLRYLFVSNVAMLFYLIGAVLVYQTHHSFNFAGLRGAPPEAAALILLGLVVKGGVFISGLWLPLTHSESETPVSALLSGIVVKAGVYPMIRCALLLNEFEPIVRWFGVAAALGGVFYAVFEKDTKRTLALSTISQLGWVLVAPGVGGFYALAHGLAKASLFLIAGNLPSRSFKQLQQQPMQTGIWVALVVASLSISGMPLLVGFGAKMSTLKDLIPIQAIAMNTAAVGTAIVYAKFIFSPFGGTGEIRSGFWLSIFLLSGSLVGANIAYPQAYTLDNLIKAVAIIGIGWVGYFLLLRRLQLSVPQQRTLEQFEHLIGVMSLMVILLFWTVLA